MDTDNIPTVGPSDWRPITDQHDLALLGKLGEETNELGAAIFRCIIQGIDEREPVNGKVNRDWLTEEIADVLALVEIAVQRLGLDIAAIGARIDRKISYKQPWFENLARRRERQT